MNTFVRRTTVLFMLVLMLAGGRAAHSDDRNGQDDYDHERARRAVEAGLALPLAEILERLGDRLGGEVVGVEFERERGQYVYEFKVITASGRLREVYVDAASAEIVKIEDD
jgi:uncharacterized membrane protein YkoI